MRAWWGGGGAVSAINRMGDGVKCRSSECKPFVVCTMVACVTKKATTQRCHRSQLNRPETCGATNPSLNGIQSNTNVHEECCLGEQYMHAVNTGS